MFAAVAWLMFVDVSVLRTWQKEKGVVDPSTKEAIPDIRKLTVSPVESLDVFDTSVPITISDEAGVVTA